MRKVFILYIKEFQYVPMLIKDNKEKCLMDLKLSN